MSSAFAVPRTFDELAWFWVPLVGCFSGVFGLFTMYLPPLFPPLLRTTGAGFSYNVGRLAAAVASILFGWLAPVGDFRTALFTSSFLAFAAALWALRLPEDRLAVSVPRNFCRSGAVLEEKAVPSFLGLRLAVSEAQSAPMRPVSQARSAGAL